MAAVTAHALPPKRGVWPPDLLITEALTQRPRRSQDLPAEIQAMHELAQQVATRSARVLDRLAELAVKLCDAGSAGVSLLEESPAGETAFRWVALAGALESYVGGSTPRDHSPCGICLDRNEPVLLSRPSRVFEYFNEATPQIVEGLVLPLHDEAGRPFGTIWIVSHEEGRGFDAGTVETMTRLASFARLIHTVERDIAQRKQFEEALRASEARLTADIAANHQLQRISAQLFDGQSVESLYQKIVDAAAVVMRSDCASMQMLHPERGEKGELQLLASRGFTPEAVQFWQWVRADSGCSCGMALRIGRRAIASDVETCDFMAGTADRTTYLQAGIRAVQSTPLLSRSGRLLGMISTHWARPHVASESDLQRLDVLARQAADLIERAQAERALRHSREQLEAIVNDCPLGVYLIDGDFRLCQVNSTALPVFGDITDLIGRDFDEVLHILWPRPYADELVLHFRRTLETGEPCHVPEFSRQRLDRGVTEYYDWRLHRIRLPGGGHGVVCYFRDISAQVRARLALEAADRQKDEFLAMLAHELRNPLAPIANATEILSRTRADDERARGAVDMIKRQTGQLTRLVDDLLDVSRITQGRIELKCRPIDLASIIAQAIETVEPQLRAKQHRLSTHVETYEPLYVSGDPTRLVQCVGNVLTNAIKYTDADGEIRIQSRAEGGQAMIEIADNGAGIAAELLPRIFDLFVQSDRTLDRAQGGLGIGLCVVKRLVQMHGGEVAARSAGLGHGSTFEICLPRIARPEAVSVDAKPRNVPPRRVFIVDDNRDAAHSLAALLSLQGHETHVAFNARQALEDIERFQPDVALLDLGLPEMDGFALARRLRAMPQLKDIRLVALTGYGQPEDRQRTRDAGFDVHLVKPVDLSALERGLAAERPDRS